MQQTHSDTPKMYQPYDHALAISKVLKLTGIGQQTIFRILRTRLSFAQVLRHAQECKGPR